MFSRMRWALAALGIASAAISGTTIKQEASLEAGRRAYEASEYAKAVQALQAAAAKDPQNGDVQLLLAKSYLEMQEHDPAIKSAERAVAIDPQNSVYHEWLGRAYGEKADHASWFSAISLAKKTRKQFETAVQLDAKNYAARQALIEFDCSAPGLVEAGRIRLCRRFNNCRSWTRQKDITRRGIADGRKKISLLRMRNSRRR